MGTLVGLSPAQVTRWTSWKQKGTAFTWDHVEDVLEFPRLIGYIAGKDKLLPLHDEWIRYIWDTNETRALHAHRGSYKTTAIDIIGPIRWLLWRPDDRIAIMRKTYTDAADVTTAIAQIMDMPEIKALFKVAHGGAQPQPSVKKYGSLRYNFKKTASPEPSILALGIDSSITGKHFDKMMIDDPITLKDRISRAVREQTKEVLREVLTNIIDPGQGVGFSGTPWHRDDGWSIIPVEPVRYTIDDTGILTPEDIERKRKSTTPFLFNANYNLRIDTDGAQLFMEPEYAPWIRVQQGSFAHVDAAFDGDHYCSLTIMSERPNDSEKIQAIGFVYPGNVKDWLEFIVSKCKHYRVNTLYIETNPDKGYTADALKRMGVHVEPYAETTNKHVKISTYLYKAWKNIIWDDESDDEYLAQVLDYREGSEPDDAPDSAASLVRQQFDRGAVNESLWSW